MRIGLVALRVSTAAARSAAHEPVFCHQCNLQQGAAQPACGAACAAPAAHCGAGHDTRCAGVWPCLALSAQVQVLHLLCVLQLLVLVIMPHAESVAVAVNSTCPLQPHAAWCEVLLHVSACLLLLLHCARSFVLYERVADIETHAACKACRRMQATHRA